MNETSGVGIGLSTSSDLTTALGGELLLRTEIRKSII
jgi:hypothetical protein